MKPARNAVRTRVLGPDGVPTEAPKYDFSRGIPNIELVGPWLLILRPEEYDLVTDSGLTIPKHAQDTATEGLVMLTGDDRVLPNGERIPPRVEPGWEIIYARYAGIDMGLDGAKYVLIQESEVRVVLKYNGRYFIPEKPEQEAPEQESEPELEHESSPT